MRYFGSKTLLLPEIEKLSSDFTPTGVFCDPFGGIGTVGKHMKKRGYQVVTGDALFFAHCFQVAYIVNNGEMQFNTLTSIMGFSGIKDLERYLNSLHANDGWFIREYANKRAFFTLENAKRIQGCLDVIYNWKRDDLINGNEYKILISSLIESFDKVANTAGTYYAYLKHFYRKALKSFQYSIIEPYTSENKCQSYHMDANQLVRETNCDILYLDPPYNSRSYKKYYHLPENIANGIIPIPVGKSGVYSDNMDNSMYNKRLKATEAFEDLINQTTAKCIIFHYTDNGLIEINTARDILQSIGTTEDYYFQCKGYNTSTTNLAPCQHHIIRVIR